MTLTVLIDLDDTLLNNHVDDFVPAYLKTLSKHLEKHVAPSILIPSLLAATKIMQENNNPTLSLEEVFDQSFYPAIGKPKTELHPIIEQFYDEVFPTLKKLTNSRPEAPGVISKIIQQGHLLMLATNPVFPQKAVLHRLRWAGLDPEQVPFAAITSYEAFHFAKPNPAFLAEIIAQAGYPNQPAVMIGNSLQDDLIPAHQLGMPVYWVSQEPGDLPEEFHPLSAKGGLAEVPVWIEHIDQARIRQEILPPAGLLAVLKSTPAALDRLIRNLTGDQLQIRPEPQEWSLAEIFCHLRDVDRDVNIPRFTKLLHEENPFLAGIDTDAWANEREYFKSDGRAAFQSFVEVRREMIALLEGVAGEEWRRPARHAIFGPTSLAELVNFVTIHDRSHVQQALDALHRIE
jgi:FMN phosphatase YigB (HAD superfamily)